jgi:hypothetical protein
MQRLRKVPQARAAASRRMGLRAESRCPVRVSATLIRRSFAKFLIVQAVLLPHLAARRCSPVT